MEVEGHYCKTSIEEESIVIMDRDKGGNGQLQEVETRHG